MSRYIYNASDSTIDADFCQVITPNANETVTLARGYVIKAPVVGTGVTITTLIGLRFESLINAPATNNIYCSDNDSASGNWLFNFTNTSPSSLAGNLTVGLIPVAATSSHFTSGDATVNQTLLTGTTQNSINARIRINSSATVAGYAVNTSLQLENSSFTCPIAANFRGNAISKGASATCTRAATLYLDAQTIGGTGNAMICDNVTFTNSWGLNLTGTNPHYFVAPLCTARGDVASAASINPLTSSFSFVRLTGVTATTIVGIAAGRDGQRLTLFNNTGANLTINNEAAGASASDRIQTNTGADVVSTGNCCYEFIYDASQSRWILVAGTA